MLKYLTKIFILFILIAINYMLITKPTEPIKKNIRKTYFSHHITHAKKIPAKPKVVSKGSIKASFSKPIFIKTRRIPKENKKHKEQLKNQFIAPPNAILLGIIMNNSTPKALIEVQGSEEKLYIIGDKIRGWTVADITHNSILLSYKDKTKIISLYP